MKTVALISGGLDSILAARLIKEQLVSVIPLYFKIPFCHKKSSSNKLDAMARSFLGESLSVIELGEPYLEIIRNPRHGVGSNMNPCIDCKILMLRRAAEFMREQEAAFIVTGEVLGQRPMSQQKKALEAIARFAGLEGFILRPLSAQLLPETIPEREGWIKRERLLGFSGRSRKPQIELAESFGITEYAQPAGGCLLTDPEFARRLKEVIAHDELNMDNIELLKLGRHFRLAQDAKLVVGRNEKENSQLLGLAREGDYIFSPAEDLAGPAALGRGLFTQELTRLACSITSRYCDLNGKKEAEIFYARVAQALPNQEKRPLRVFPAKEEEINNLRI